MRRLVGLVDLRSRLWDALVILAVVAGLWMAGAAAWRIFFAPARPVVLAAEARDGPGGECDGIPGVTGADLRDRYETGQAWKLIKTAKAQVSSILCVAVENDPALVVEDTSVFERDCGASLVPEFKIVGCYDSHRNTVIVRPTSLNVSTVAHEIAHAAVAQIDPAPPSWLNEAIATIAEGTPVLGADAIAMPKIAVDESQQSWFDVVGIGGHNEYEAAATYLQSLLWPHSVGEFMRESRRLGSLIRGFEAVTGRPLAEAMADAVAHRKEVDIYVAE